MNEHKPAELDPPRTLAETNEVFIPEIPSLRRQAAACEIS
jgi:hypothetical protein